MPFKRFTVVVGISGTHKTVSVDVYATHKSAAANRAVKTVEKLGYSYSEVKYISESCGFIVST